MHHHVGIRSTSLKRGFTLIELLVVIAIIGILASVILTSLSTARAKSRDAKRITEVGQIRKALELFYDANQTYPSTTPTGYSGEDAGIQLLVANGVLPKNPIPPAGTNATYLYRGVIKDPDTGALSECVGVSACNSFEIGVTLEQSDNIVLQKDQDQSVGVFYGANPDCASVTLGNEQCYDIAP